MNKAPLPLGVKKIGKKAEIPRFVASASFSFLHPFVIE
jgi:hypothetical protein